jgi:hypothetical protein
MEGASAGGGGRAAHDLAKKLTNKSGLRQRTSSGKWSCIRTIDRQFHVASFQPSRKKLRATWQDDIAPGTESPWATAFLDEGPAPGRSFPPRDAAAVAFSRRTVLLAVGVRTRSVSTPLRSVSGEVAFASSNCCTAAYGYNKRAAAFASGQCPALITCFQA